jgi:hypothetical protein
MSSRAQTKATRQKIGLAIKKLFLARKWKPWNAGKKLPLAMRRKISMAGLKYFSNPEARRKRGRIMSKAFKRLGTAKLLDKKITAWWREHPNIKKINSKRMKAEFAKHPEALKKFMSYGKNPFKLKLKTKQGFLVRSKGELAIANFLFENNIWAFYEAKPLQLDGNPCVPDFWLPKFKTYIEFYGGYPGAWKKKVLKNKLYKKYKIPVISITPAELEDLDYYLIRELKK